MINNRGYERFPAKREMDMASREKRVYQAGEKNKINCVNCNRVIAEEVELREGKVKIKCSSCKTVNSFEAAQA